MGGIDNKHEQICQVTNNATRKSKTGKGLYSVMGEGRGEGRPL